jgi:hypothetical protein
MIELLPNPCAPEITGWVEDIWGLSARRNSSIVGWWGCHGSWNPILPSSYAPIFKPGVTLTCSNGKSFFFSLPEKYLSLIKSIWTGVPLV